MHYILFPLTRWFGLLLLLLLVASCRKETGFRPLPEDTVLFISTPPTVQADSADALILPARFYGTITAQGSDSVTRYGFCFSASHPKPTLADSLVVDSAKVSQLPFSFILNTTQLKRATQYYLRAFAENKQGISYGEEVIQFVVPDNRTIPVVVTDAIENVTSASANAKAAISSDGQSPITAYGFCLSTTNSTPGLADQVVIAGTSTAGKLPFAYAQLLQSLTNNTTYYVRAFASNAMGTAYGSSRSFKTVTAVTVAPTIQTDNVLNVSANTASVDGTITAKGTANITRYGFCYSTTNPNPTTGDGVIQSGTASPADFPFSFSGSLAGLKESTDYFVRAFAVSSVGTSYGVTRSFRTLSNVTIPPTVQTNDVSATSVTTNAATANGTLQAKGSAPITQYGFCYSSTQSNPTTADQVLTVGTTSPSGFPFAFAGNLTGLVAGTSYQVRAFAVNSVGTSYGVSYSFRTVALATAPPSVQTVNVSSVSYFSANVLGNLTSKGTTELTEYGIVFSATNANPTTANSKVVVGTTSPGSFPSGYTGALAGLTANTTYNARAYATNSIGTSYGTTQRFVTPVATPTVTTGQVNYSEPGNSVTAQGTIQNPGATAISRYGFCYSATNPNPTIADNLTEVGTTVRGAFPFSFTQSWLRLPAGSYYFRAYAFNSSGVTYGSVSSVTVFTRPAITTDEATVKDNAGGIETLFGTITAGGSAPLQEYGFCFIPTAKIGRLGFQVGDRNVAVVRRTTPVPTSFPFRYFMDATVTYNVDYSYKAYVKTANGYSYGAVKTFYISYKP